MVKIDKEKCIGCGSCVATCPDVFIIKDGKSYLKPTANPKASCVKEAINNCPTNSIS